MSTSNGAVALSVSGLNKSYGNFEVIKDLNLQIQSGSVHGLVGLNGSGKTTTLECILGLQPFNSGSITLLGLPPASLHLSKGRIVGIFDSPSLHPNLTVRQCLQHASLLCVNCERTPDEVEQLLGIDRFSHFKIKHLSLGNKRRASIAQALLGKTELIVLDEPFNGLDAEGVDDVLQLITQLNRQEGTAFLLSSHQLPYLEQICSHIAILHKGSIAISDDITSLLKSSGTEVLLKTPHVDAAIAAFSGMPEADYSHTDADGYLHVQVGAMNSAELNRRLVAEQIDISELILQRGSLGKLFREITNEGGS